MIVRYCGQACSTPGFQNDVFRNYLQCTRSFRRAAIAVESLDPYRRPSRLPSLSPRIRVMRVTGGIALSKATFMVPALFVLLSGCATYRMHEAREAQGELVGSNIVDLLQSVGIPDKTMKVVNTGGPGDQMIAQWNFSNSDSALDMTLILLDLKVGGAGKCSMTATVDRWGGKVVAINFPQAHADSIGSDYNACEPLVSEAITHMPHTPIDPKFDAFTLVGAAK